MTNIMTVACQNTSYLGVDGDNCPNYTILYTAEQPADLSDPVVPCPVCGVTMVVVAAIEEFVTAYLDVLNAGTGDAPDVPPVPEAPAPDTLPYL